MRFRHIKKHLIFTILGWCVLWVPPGFTQDENPDGGTEHIFNFAVGAHALSLGGAYVAVAHDATALYWNPANLENSTHYNLSLYYTNLAEGTSYNYIAYAHPTLSIGTIALGVVHISTGDVPLRGVDSPLLLGYSSNSQTQFMLGYAYRFLDLISIGASFKVERFAYPPYAQDVTGELLGAETNVSPFVMNGAGGDFGILLTPQSKGWLLNDISIGLIVQNAVQRSMQAKVEKDLAGRNFRLGLAKGVQFGGTGNRILLAFELDRAEKSSLEYHFGTEYDFRRNAMLRVGYDNGTMTYGLGVRFTGIQLDYSYWNGWDALLGSSHRISLTLEFGKSRDQRRREIQERQIEEMRRELRDQRELETRRTIHENIQKARSYFAAGDYPHAYTAAYKVLAYEETRDDSEIEEARSLLEQVEAKMAEQREKELAEERIRDEQESARRRRAQLVDDHFKKALAFLQNEDYIEAIEECDRALEVDSTSQQVKDLREKADKDLRLKVGELTLRADGLARRGLIMEALELYRQARSLGGYIPLYSSYADGQIRELEKRLNFDNLLRRADNYENAKDFASAAEMYQRALIYQPNNQAIRERYDFVRARAQAKDMEMTPEVRALWKEGTRKNLAKKYEEAIDYFERARQLQPLNKIVLDALDSAKENLRKQQEQTGTSE